MPATSKDWVLRVPRSENASEFVLIYVSPTGKAALDLKFTATEGENPYVGVRMYWHLHPLKIIHYEMNKRELQEE